MDYNYIVYYVPVKMEDSNLFSAMRERTGVKPSEQLLVVKGHFMEHDEEFKEYLLDQFR